MSRDYDVIVLGGGSPGEHCAGALAAAGQAAGKGEVEVERALAWRDYMVSGYSDVGQERWLGAQGIQLLRGHGRLAGTGVVEVAGERYYAAQVILATGSDPVRPPIAGLAGLEGIWTNREATAMKSVPRRLLVLGGGPAGVELSQAVRRLGGKWC